MVMDQERVKSVKKVLGPSIRKARQRRGLSQARLAELLEMSTEVLGRMERKQVLPRLERLVLLCEILEVTPNELLGFGSAASAPAAPRTSPAFDEMMTAMRRFFLQLEGRLSEEERKELMQTFSHLQRLITLIKKKEPARMPRRTRKSRARQKD
jgi:transcriptional regulator with XRE-family HTH domain